MLKHANFLGSANIVFRMKRKTKNKKMYLFSGWGRQGLFCKRAHKKFVSKFLAIHAIVYHHEILHFK